MQSFGAIFARMVSLRLKFGLCLWVFALFFWSIGHSLYAQTFRIKPPNLFNSAYGDSIQPVFQYELLAIDSTPLFQIKQKLGSNPPGAFINLRLENADHLSGALYLRFCRLAENVAVFRILNDSVTYSPLNQSSKGHITLLPSSQHYYHLPIGMGQVEHLLLYLEFPENMADPHYKELFLSDAQQLEKHYMDVVTWQSLYAGMVWFIVLLSLVSAYFLKDRSLLFFGFHMVFWIPYFQMQHNLISFWDQLLPTLNMFEQSSFNIVFLLGFASLFASEFLELNRRLGKGFWVFSGVNILVVGLLLYSTFFHFLQWMNYPLVLVLLMYLLMAMYLSIKGVKAAQHLLISISALLVGGLVMSLTLSGMVASTPFTPYFFQLGSLIFSLILFFSLAKRISKIRRDKREAENLISIKTRFFQDISHELRSPLSLVINPIRKVYSELPPGSLKEEMAVAKNAGEGLENLVNQILDLSKHEFKPPPLRLVSGNLNTFLRTLCSQYSSMAESRQITLSYSGTQQALVCAYDAEKMQQMVSNLITNALKFTPSGGQVEVSLKALTEETVEIKVADTGMGISAKALPHIFNRFYQDPEAPPQAQPGTGIGLALCKALVVQHNGSIEVESTPQKGSTFIVRMPLGLLKPSEIVGSKEAVANGRSYKPLVLVAEDHPDLRTYLKQCLSETYEVITAKNGQEAWQFAQERLPDIVLSDLMMPDLNGIELTRNLKSNKQTCHIPVLLLTAKSDQDSVNEGLAAGADDYISKPFNSDELLLRLANILKQLEAWRQRVANLDLPKVAENTLNKIDKAFLKQLEELLGNSFSNPGFGVEELAEMIGMSKTHLNRKLNTLLGHPANKMIQNYRLREARKMLTEKQGNVSEIAFSCGFNSPAYFVKCFKEKYHETPGQML